MAGCVLQAVDTVGEILLSLSYLPTAERLTVVVVKAKNLVWSSGKATAGERGTGVLVLLHTPGDPILLHPPTMFIGVALTGDRPPGRSPSVVPPFPTSRGNP